MGLPHKILFFDIVVISLKWNKVPQDYNKILLICHPLLLNGLNTHGYVRHTVCLLLKISKTTNILQNMVNKLLTTLLQLLACSKDIMKFKLFYLEFRLTVNLNYNVKY